MYALRCHSRHELDQQCGLFQAHMEPLLRNLESAKAAGLSIMQLPELDAYLEVCRWPFRQLEYSFALDLLLERLGRDTRFLDAGSGVTPFAHIFAARGVEAHACDGDRRIVDGMHTLHPEHVYRSPVTYATQDITAMSYPDGWFDAVACISVLEHIPAPLDQQAVHELLRVLKPGGLLVLTVDFAPAPATPRLGKLTYIARRVITVTKQDGIGSVRKAAARKRVAKQAVRTGEARNARTAHQCFDVAHLEQDILPLLPSEELPVRVPFASGLRAAVPRDARRLWDFEPELFKLQGGRTVLPAATAIRKPLSVA
jgi:SAM-dependent methyltransferase